MENGIAQNVSGAAGGTLVSMRESSVKFLFISVQKDVDVLGLKCLHYTLIANSFESCILFVPALNLENDSLDEFGKFVEDMAPDIIGFSVMSIDFNPASELSKYLKKYSPNPRFSPRPWQCPEWPRQPLPLEQNRHIPYTFPETP